ncbi:MAG: C4-type zinc ribbon domain-containing protein [Candidatus Nanopelagicales bacterium]|nr:C4-type zinc ribbon domain-containing protein [Candidatus Nanopelagicales bacterium]
MKADPSAQRRLLDLRDIDGSLLRLRHRVRQLREDPRVRELSAREGDIKNELVRVGAEAQDLVRLVTKAEDETARVRQRAKRDREIASSGVGARQQQDLQHELATLARRESELEDAELELMQRQEDLATIIAQRTGQLEKLGLELKEAVEARDAELARLGSDERELAAHRAELVSGIPSELVGAYEVVRTERGVGAAELEGNRCMGCRLDLAPMEAERIRSASPDEVEFCEECGCVLVR